MPDITIGDNSVIGAGSVVTKNIPSNVVAVGNPCRVLREIGTHDRKYFYKNFELDLTRNWSIFLCKNPCRIAVWLILQAPSDPSEGACFLKRFGCK